MLDAGGDNKDNQDMGEDSRDAGASTGGSMRVESPMLREVGLVEMEREARESGLGGWFNGMEQGLLESWSGPNSNASSSQDQVWTMVLTTIGG